MSIGPYILFIYKAYFYQFQWKDKRTRPNQRFHEPLTCLLTHICHQHQFDCLAVHFFLLRRMKSGLPDQQCHQGLSCDGRTVSQQDSEQSFQHPSWMYLSTTKKSFRKRPFDLLPCLQIFPFLNIWTLIFIWLFPMKSKWFFMWKLKDLVLKNIAKLCKYVKKSLRMEGDFSRLSQLFNQLKDADCAGLTNRNNSI